MVTILGIEFWSDWPKAGDTAFDVRAKSTQSWVTAEGDFVPANQTRVVGTGTITALRPTLPSIHLPSTSAGFDRQDSRWTVTLHRTGKSDVQLTVLDSFSLPVVFEPSTTWGEIKLFKQGNNNYIWRDNGGFSRTDTLNLINSRSQPKASEAVYGVVRTDVAPDISTQPIVPGINSPLLQDLIYATDPRVDINRNCVLTFALHQMIDCGNFFTGDLNHSFFCDVLAKPGIGASSVYMVSDGSGGGHALLFGTVSDGVGGYQLSGNVWDSTAGVARTFGSDQGPRPNEWCHLSVGLDRINNRIVTRYNGVPVGLLAFTGARGAAPSAGQLYIGGSDHQNWIGSIAQIRIYEGSNPHEEVLGNNADTAAHVPPSLFMTRENGYDANFLMSFLRPSPIVPDLGIGFPAGTFHSGRLRGSGQFFDDVSSSVLGAGNATGTTSTYPLPQYEIDTTAPTYRTDQLPVPPETTLTPAAVPSGAIVFDSFNRRNKTWAFDENGGLGSTEGGSAGPLVWTPKAVDPGEYYPFGILCGMAVVLANKTTWAYVNAGLTNQDIRVSRLASSTWSCGVSTGLIFRYTDALNYWWAYTLGTTTTGQLLYVVKTVAGVQTTLINGVAMPPAWTVLKVVTLPAGTVKVYADSTQVDSTITDSAGATATRSGILCPTTGRGLYYRYDNFTVLPA
jgi:hypothetical protein